MFSSWLLLRFCGLLISGDQKNAVVLLRGSDAICAAAETRCSSSFEGQNQSFMLEVKRESKGGIKV